MIHFPSPSLPRGKHQEAKLAENGLETILSQARGPYLNACPCQVPKIQLLPTPSLLLLQKGWHGWNAQYTVMLMCWSCDNYQASARGKGSCSGRGADKKGDFPTAQMTGCWGLNISLAYGRGSQPGWCVSASSSAGSVRGLSCIPCMSQFQGWALLAHTAASKMDDRRVGSAPQSNWKRWKWKINDLSLLLERGRQGAKSLRKSRNNFSWNKTSVSNGERALTAAAGLQFLCQSLSALWLTAASLS